VRACLAALFLVLEAAWMQALANNTVQSFGIGGQICTYWLSSPERELAGRSWALGFWTAYNNLNGNTHLVGSKSDAEAILAEIKEYCLAEPSSSLGAAVARVYEQFLQDGK
jgi:hypothetical protein